jgi:hypothetical protein
MLKESNWHNLKWMTRKNEQEMLPTGEGTKESTILGHQKRGKLDRWPIWMQHPKMCMDNFGPIFLCPLLF